MGKMLEKMGVEDQKGLLPKKKTVKKRVAKPKNDENNPSEHDETGDLMNDWDF